MRKQFVIAGTVATLGLTGLIGGAAFATAQAGADNNTLVQAIATKFNLKTAEVQAVFDANKTQVHAEREQQAKDKVAQLVSDGKLTQTQADKINAKRAELEKEREANRAADQNLTEAEHQAKRDARRAEMDTRKAQLDTWMKDNGIGAEYRYLLTSGGKGHGGSGGHGRMMQSAMTTQ